MTVFFNTFEGYDVSEVLAVFIVRAMKWCPEDGGIKHL
jgi:hypothetical protein